MATLVMCVAKQDYVLLTYVLNYCYVIVSLLHLLGRLRLANIVDCNLFTILRIVD